MLYMIDLDWKVALEESDAKVAPVRKSKGVKTFRAKRVVQSLAFSNLRVFYASQTGAAKVWSSFIGKYCLQIKFVLVSYAIMHSLIRTSLAYYTMVYLLF